MNKVVTLPPEEMGLLERSQYKAASLNPKLINFILGIFSSTGMWMTTSHNKTAIITYGGIETCSALLVINLKHFTGGKEG